MTPDEQFSRLIRIAMAGFALMFLYFLFADLNLPLTTESMATRAITKVAPRISGNVEKVNVGNNQVVAKGDILFEIDPAPFQLAVDEAQLALEQARQNNDELDASIKAAQAEVRASQSISTQKNREAKRMDNLFANHGVSRQEKDQADSSAISSRASLLSVQAQLEKLKVTRGLGGEANLQVRQAQNHLQQAQLNLAYTKVRAEKDGLITNLHLEKGIFRSAGSPALALVSQDVDIIADFREKNIMDTVSGDKAYITFDGKPGEVFKATVQSLDAGVSAGQFDANGELATPQSSTRWVRDAQRMRVHFTLDKAVNFSLPAGARASAQLIPDNSILAGLAYLQIKFISALHYIY